MGREPRVEYPGALYHVTARGNRGNVVFVHDTDRHIFLVGLEAVVRERRWICHAYCLMGTHYHLVIETPEANLGDGMQALHTAYVHRFNATHGYEGHLLERRYRAPLLDDERHLHEVLRYVPLNPVSAGLCAEPQEWQWSSYASTIGLAPQPDWLTTEFTIGVFEGVDGFRSWVEAGAARRPLELVLADGTGQAMRTARAMGYTLREIGECLGVTHVTVWRHVTAVPGTAVTSDSTDNHGRRPA
jgi:REP-associated tyrosine transposase